jgi:3-deoxy-D-manno-octulosonic-acid transferase
MSAAMPLTLRLYGLAATLATPVAPLVIAMRTMRGKEDPKRSAERRGRASRPRPKGPLIWLHGASVGEAVTVLPLAERLAERGFAVLLTSGTVTSASVVARRKAKGVIHHYVPLDIPAFVRRFLDHWRPDLAIFAESELWPSMIVEAHRRRVPLVLVNARMSRRSFERWRRLPRTIGPLLRRFEACLAQSAEDASRFAALGAPHVAAPGNLKFDAPAPPADPARLASLRAAVAPRPIVLAASTHPGEEAVLADVHLGLKRRVPGLLTIIAPRHPDRGDDIAAELAQRGLVIVQRARGVLPDSGTDIYLADTVGELGLFYRLSRIVFVGGTLVPHGGQNPIEPAKLGCAILHGPHVDNFRDAFEVLDQTGGARAVGDTRALGSALARLLHDHAGVEEMARAAGSAVGTLGGALDRTLGALDPYLMQISLERR